MEDVSGFVADVLVVVAAGLVAGAACKRIGISMLVGYLVVGAIIGNGALGLVAQENHELEYLASAGVLLLLFSVGIEFSVEELMRLSRYVVVGGTAQMLLVAVPLSAACLALGSSVNVAILLGSAGALSSTVLVFKALSEWGQTETPHGRRAIGIVLFQDIALVPLMLLVPLLTQQGEAPTITAYLGLAQKSLIFLVAIVLAKLIVSKWIVLPLARLRSVELVVLFAICILGGVCWGAYRIGLPAPVGALAAGIVLSGNRISKQIDTVILPFRETFAAIFFVTLGTLLNPMLILDNPLVLVAGLCGMLVLKATAATVALRIVGLRWTAAAGMGMGLAQMGEFSFLLLAEGLVEGLISPETYQIMLFIALGTLIATPELLRIGLRWTDDFDEGSGDQLLHSPSSIRHAVVIGIGPIGKQVASGMETMGIDVCLVDHSPVNLHPFAQQGFHTVAGDARDASVLRRAELASCSLVVVSVPDDEVTLQVMRVVRSLNPVAAVVVRCRYQSNIGRLQKVGASAVVSEEAEASNTLLQLCEGLVGSAGSKPQQN